jgi:2-dehydro-3-deoxygluconokinase
MALIPTRPAGECRFDALSLGEVMLRLDPGDFRIRTTRSFRVWEGGGEYNVIRGLRRCFGLRTSVMTAFADNEIGRLAEDLILTGGVDTSLIRWVPHDGVGRTVRNGLNFVERGFGARGPLGVSDRGHTAISQLKPGDVDWSRVFGELGVRWFHTGGIFASLSPSAPEVVAEAARAARRHGTIMSYDLNYRPSLWQDNGGLARAREVNTELIRHVDVLFGIDAPDDGRPAGADPGPLTAERARGLITEMAGRLPHLKAIATTLRTVHSATVNDWGAIAWAGGEFAEATHRSGLEIYDRVGGGDSFASGFIYGLMTFDDLITAVEYGAAHGALAMTTPGDTSMASLAEVAALASGGKAHVQR